MFTQIPLINFGPFLNGTDEDRKKVSLEMGDACQNVVFFIYQIMVSHLN
jgi:hypothetical protein